MLYWEQDGYMGQSLPSMGERYFLKNLIREVAVLTGRLALCWDRALASGDCHGPFMGSSWATAAVVKPRRQAARIALSLFMYAR